MRRQACKGCGTHRCIHKRNGRKRVKGFTSEYQRWARSFVKRESLQRAGRLGFAACAAKYGFQFATERVARWRRANPSSLERTVMAWLDELGERYVHDRPFLGRYLLYPDFQLAQHKLIVEVDGQHWHRNSAERDAEKDALYRRNGYQVLRLSEQSVKSGCAKRRLADCVTKGNCDEHATI